MRVTLERSGRDRRADPEAGSVGAGEVPELADAAQVDHAAGAKHAVLELWQEIGPAGHQLGVRPAFGQDAQALLYGFGQHQVKASHASPLSRPDEYEIPTPESYQKARRSEAAPIVARAPAESRSPLDVLPGQDLFPCDDPRPSGPPERRILQDRPAPDVGREPDPHRTLGVESHEGSAHQRAPGVVAKPALVVPRGEIVAGEVRVGQVAERRPAHQAHDLLLRDRTARILEHPPESRQPLTLTLPSHPRLPSSRAAGRL